MSPRARLVRGLGVAAALVLAAAAAGCSRPVPARAVPSQCALHQRPHCADLAPPVPRHRGDQLFHEDPVARTQELCTAIAPAERDRLLGQPTYAVRDVRDNSCSIESATRPVVDQDGQLSAPQQLHIWISSYPQPMQGYRIVDGNTPTELAGHPALRNDLTTSGLATRQYTIATGPDPGAGGVLFVRIGVDHPPGDAQIGTPVDPGPLAATEPLASSLIQAVL